jgi:hypothetical protein
MFETKVVEKIKARFMFSNFFSRKSCRLWDNVEKYGTARQATDDNIIRRMRFTCWITTATDTHSEYVILIAFPQQQWLRERASVLRYTYIACLVYSGDGGSMFPQNVGTDLPETSHYNTMTLSHNRTPTIRKFRYVCAASSVLNSNFQTIRWCLLHVHARTHTATHGHRTLKLRQTLTSDYTHNSQTLDKSIANPPTLSKISHYE